MAAWVMQPVRWLKECVCVCVYSLLDLAVLAGPGCGGCGGRAEVLLAALAITGGGHF